MKPSEGHFLSRPSRQGSATAFTMAELLVVMAIIVLFIVLAIPAISAITGTRSIAAAENNLSALLARAREEAVGVQETRGVLFYADPATGGIVGIIVRDIGGSPDAILDVVPSHDYLSLPKGVRLQTMFDGERMKGNNANRYFGYNNGGISGFQDPTFPVKYGGVILFDAKGQLAVRRYAFQLEITGVPTGLGDVLHLSGAAPAVLNPMLTGNDLPFSQTGLVLFDKQQFQTPGFDDGDRGLDRPSDETEEELWLDQNGTPLLINRYTGTIIRGE